jgi:hypothetical protein
LPVSTPRLRGSGKQQDGVKTLIHTPDKMIEGIRPALWVRMHGLGRCSGSRIEARGKTDGEDEEARQAFLQ